MARDAIDIVLVRSNSTIHDVRVGKIARSLNRRYSLRILGWQRERDSPAQEYPAELKLLHLRAPFGRKSVILYYPFFWSWVLLELLRFEPKIVHACDVDTVIPCYLYKIMLKRKLVFDLFDRYAMVYLGPDGGMVYNFVNRLEELLSKRADIFITVGESYFEGFKSPPSKYFIILNCPEDRKFEGNRNDTFALVYTGPVQSNRGLQQMTEATRDLSDVILIIAGRIIDSKLAERIFQLPNVQYKGLLTPTEALDLEGFADVILILYDLNTPQMQFVMPNKIFEAMMHGIPVITNVAVDLVIETQCGIVVNYNSIEEIRRAVLKLKEDPALRTKLGQNGRLAYIEKYNWSAMEKILYEIYDNLLSLPTLKI